MELGKEFKKYQAIFSSFIATMTSYMATDRYKSESVVIAVAEKANTTLRGLRINVGDIKLALFKMSQSQEAPTTYPPPASDITLSKIYSEIRYASGQMRDFLNDWPYKCPSVRRRRLACIGSNKDCSNRKTVEVLEEVKGNKEQNERIKKLFQNISL